ncbi:hypothetical protein GQ457_05G032240 [Hibiscus cannabinus]
MRRYSPQYYSPPRRGYGGRERSPPRRGYGGGGGGGSGGGGGGGYGRRREQNNGSLLVRNIPLDCSHELHAFLSMPELVGSLNLLLNSLPQLRNYIITQSNRGLMRKKIGIQDPTNWRLLEEIFSLREIVDIECFLYLQACEDFSTHLLLLKLPLILNIKGKGQPLSLFLCKFRPRMSSCFGAVFRYVKYTKAARGFAFVQFVDSYDAAEAQWRMNGKIFGGREISVVVAAEDRKRPEEMRHKARLREPSGYGGRSSYYGRSRSRSISPMRSHHRPSGSRGRYRSRSYSPVPRRRGDYSVSPDRRHKDH